MQAALQHSNRRLVDPRRYQIFCLLAILSYGLANLEFARYLDLFGVYVGTALASQFVCLWLLRRLRPELKEKLPYEFKSALITALSLSLLLRVGSPWLAALAAGLAVGAKFLIRIRRKHLFNPSLSGIVMLLLLNDAVWVSPGQWGRPGLLLFGVCLGGGFILYRSLRADISLAFLGAYGLLVFARAAYLDDGPAIALHQLSNGALLIFAFFMISDPPTTPDRRAGRIVFASLVAATAVYLQFVLYNTNALLWSLFAWSLTVPIIDRFLPGARFAWTGNFSPENNHEPRKVSPDGRNPGRTAPVYGGV